MTPSTHNSSLSDRNFEAETTKLSAMCQFADSIVRLVIYVRPIARRLRILLLLQPKDERMVHRSPCSNFLNLPPEIRNHIYVFTTHAPAGAKRCVVPCLALAQSCRQIRREYRPICLKADVSMDWKDVPLYLDQFFPTRDGIVTDIELAPGRMNIFTDNSSAEIDMLTILKFGLANESFDCQFSKGAKAPSDCGVIHEEDDDLSEEDLSTLFNADVDTIKKLLAHRHPHWVADVAEGRIHRLMITQIGTNSYPQAKFHIGQGTDTQLPDEFAKIRERKAQTQMENPRHNRGVANRFHVSAPPHYFDEYVERIRLDNIFLANQYSFLWNYEWIEEDTSCKPVKVKIDAEQNSHYTTGA